MNLAPTTMEEVTCAAKLKPKKAYGPDRVPAEFCKIICVPLLVDGPLHQVI